MTDSVAPPADAVRTGPEGRAVYGMQLPVQSQSTLYTAEWETSSGPAEIARVARAADDAGYFYVGVCDHTAIPRRLADAMSTVWYDTTATLGWLAGITSRVRLLSHVLILLIINDSNSVWSVAASLFPPTAPVIMFLRMASEIPPLWQLATSIGLLMLSIWGVLWFATRLYRVGILMYGKRATLPELMRWIRYS